MCDTRRGVSKPETSGTLIRSTIEKALANEGPLRHTLLRTGNSTAALPQREPERLLNYPGSPLVVDHEFLWIRFLEQSQRYPSMLICLEFKDQSKYL